MTTGVHLTRRGFLVITILFSCFFSWYFSFALSVLRKIAGTSAEIYLLINASFAFVIAITLLLSSFFIHKYSKIRIIYGYSVVTFVISILSLVAPSLFLRLIVVFVTGILFS